MNDIDHIDIEEWVDQEKASDRKEFRQAVHTVLAAIASHKKLKPMMIMKGGMLLAVRYQSIRFTKDIDFSTSKTLEDLDPEEVVSMLDEQLTITSDQLPYDLDCRVQKYKKMPASQQDATFPSIKLKIGYAYKGTSKHKRLAKKNSPTAVSIDYSLNELTPNLDDFKIDSENSILVYSFLDLLAEKFRSLLQQVKRNRNRRQDIFDLFLLLDKFDDITEEEKYKIHKCLMDKALSRGINPEEGSLDNEEIRARTKAEYHTLDDEVEGELPDFDESYDVVNVFYKTLPWNS